MNSIQGNLHQLSQLKFFFWGSHENTGTLFLPLLSPIFKIVPQNCKRKIDFKGWDRGKGVLTSWFFPGCLCSSLSVFIPLLASVFKLVLALPFDLFWSYSYSWEFYSKSEFLWINTFFYFSTIPIDYTFSPICLYHFAQQLHL